MPGTDDTRAMLDAHYRSCSASAIRANAACLSGMWGGRKPAERRELATALVLRAMAASQAYLAADVAEAGGGFGPDGSVMLPDGTQPIRSYMSAWVAGYAMRAMEGACSEWDIRDLAARMGLRLDDEDGREAHARARCLSSGKSRECLSMTVGHVLMTRMLEVAAEGGATVRGLVDGHSWRSDADGFADGWWAARADGIGRDRPVREWTADDERAAREASSQAPGPLALEASGVPTLAAVGRWDARGGSSVAEALRRGASAPQVGPVPGIGPRLSRHVRRCAESAMMGNVDWVAELTRAGMGYSQGQALNAALVAATARYARELAHVAVDGQDPSDLPDEVPRDGLEEPLRSYASGWLQGYVCATTDGDRGREAVTRAADVAPSGDSAIAAEVERARVAERARLQGQRADTAGLVVAHLIASNAPHSSSHPLASPVTGLPSYSMSGDADGFADGLAAAQEQSLADAADAVRRGGAAKGDDEEGDGAFDAEVAARRRAAAAVRVTSSLWPQVRLGIPRQGAGDDDEWGDADALADEMGVAPPAIDDAFDARPVASMLSSDEEIRERERASSALSRMRDRVSSYAARCVADALSRRRDGLAEAIAAAGMGQGALRAWGRGLCATCVAHAMPGATPTSWLPVIGPDGTDPIASYAQGIVDGWVDGALGRMASARDVAQAARRWRIRVGDEMAPRVAWVRGQCAQAGRGQGCTEAAVARARWLRVMADPRNREPADGITHDGTDWRQDVEGYARGWEEGSRAAAR